MKSFYKFAIFGLAMVGLQAKAQMSHDAIYMSKKTTCLAVVYGSSEWTNYWENTLKRDNPNIGKHTTQSVMAMAAVGITDRLNLIVGVPYIKTNASAGNLMGQSGVQDISLWAKYRLFESKAGLSVHGVLGASIPSHNYVPDFLPMSIGLKAKTASGRLIASYKHKSGLYLTTHGTYSYRSVIKVDRDAYQVDGRVFNSNMVAVPNATDVSARLGILKQKYQVEGFVERFACVDGDNIRRNDMPFPTNNMRATTVGGYLKFQPKNIGFNASFRQVIKGLNVGEARTYSLGLLYQINYNK